ncbi:MAG: hypothetical protein JNL90_19370 [Planctomycetes bacterium]|nr:hypothetical protein [Planctomycetota bacterium]
MRSAASSASLLVPLLAPLLATLLVSAPCVAHAQELVWTNAASGSHERFAASLAWHPDRDGDAIDELLVGAPGSARARLLSGATLATALELQGEPGSGFGTAVASIADLDGDARADLAVTAPTASQGSLVVLFSSVDGRRLGELRPAQADDAFGDVLADLGDLDGDGASELACGGSSRTSRESARAVTGTLTVISSRDGRVLARRRARYGDREFGGTLALIGDVDGDGAADLATLGHLGEGAALSDARAIELLSGRDLATLRTIREPAFDARSDLPWVLGAIGDVDGDGLPDLALSRPGIWDQAIFDSDLWVFSSRSGARLRHWHLDQQSFGSAITRAGDLDGDGSEELAIATFDASGSSPSIAAELLTIRSVRNGATLATIAADFGYVDRVLDRGFGDALLGGRDLDGDGTPDLALGEPWVWNVIGATGARRMLVDGRLLTASPRRATFLAERIGDDQLFAREGPFVALGDLDGDGIGELAIGEAAGLSPGSVALLSGADGSLLRRQRSDRHDPAFAVALAALPDLDGDGVEELAIGGSGYVEIRSARDGSLLLTLSDGLGASGVTALAAGRQPDGQVVLLVGERRGSPTAFPRGAVTLFDAASGARLHQRFGLARDDELGAALAWLGDVTGDGRGDFAIGSPGSDSAGSEAGRVAIVDGTSYATVRQLFGGAAHERLGSELATLPDLDGDAFDELLVGAPGANGASGRIVLFAGKRWTEQWRVDGDAVQQLGRNLAVLGDLEGDDRRDFATIDGTPHREGVELRSGEDGLRFTTLRGRDVTGVCAIGAAVPLALAGPARSRLALATPLPRPVDPEAQVSGAARLFALPSLFLELAPQRVAEGERVIGHVRGAPAGAFAGIYLEAIDGVPFEQFLDFGFCDATGVFRDSSVVPPGMSGLDWTLRGYAIGFDGALATSSAEALHFE